MKIILSSVAALVAVLVSTTAVHAAERIRYALMASDGKEAGEQVVERAGNGLTTVRYIYKYNGRGPELTERIRTLPDGTLSEYEARGTSELGAPVMERFARRGDTTEWQSTSEKGSGTAKGPALYIPLNGSFEMVSMSIDALAAQPEGSLPLVPSGALTQRVLDETELTNAAGQRRRVRLLAQTGLGLFPAFYWSTTDPRPRLFAVVEPGSISGIEEGWELLIETLKERQKVAEGNLLRELSAKTRQSLRGLTVVRNARIFDSETASLRLASDVYILRGRITAIRPAGSAGAIVDNEIDAEGRVMLPGLFDMHTHVDRWDGGLHLAAGVTSVRDMGNDNLKLQQILDETNAGELLAPQIVPCGLLEGDGPHAARTGFVIKTLHEARYAVDWYALRGYPQLKIYNSFPKEMVREVVAYAHSRGMRVSGHVPVFMRAQDVVEQGFDEIQHINQVLLNFLALPTTDTRTPERFYLPAKMTSQLDFEAEPVRRFIALLKRHGTVIDPTLAALSFIKQRDSTMSEPYAAISPHMPPDVQRDFRVARIDIPDDATEALYKASYAKMIKLVGLLYKAGVPIVAGTDALAGFTLQSELELYVRAGLTAAQALQVATRNGARYTRTSNDRGSIVVGKLADLVLVDGDPTTHIEDLRKVALVITQGKVIFPSMVYQSLGIQPFVEKMPKLRSNIVPVEAPAHASPTQHKH